MKKKKLKTKNVYKKIKTKQTCESKYYHLMLLWTAVSSVHGTRAAAAAVVAGTEMQYTKIVTIDSGTVFWILDKNNSS